MRKKSHQIMGHVGDRTFATNNVGNHTSMLSLESKTMH